MGTPRSTAIGVTLRNHEQNAAPNAVNLDVCLTILTGIPVAGSPSPYAATGVPVKRVSDGHGFTPLCVARHNSGEAKNSHNAWARHACPLGRRHNAPHLVLRAWSTPAAAAASNLTSVPRVKLCNHAAPRQTIGRGHAQFASAAAAATNLTTTPDSSSAIALLRSRSSKRRRRSSPAHRQPANKRHRLLASAPQPRGSATTRLRTRSDSRSSLAHAAAQ
jgi:hypothetical protein